MNPPRRLSEALMTLGLCVASLALLYAPLSFERAWPLAFVSVVPWALLVLRASRGATILAFAAAMPAYIAMHREILRISSAFHLVSWPAFALALSGGALVLRFAAAHTRAPLAVLLPTIWTAGELARSSELVPPWHRLAVALYAQPWALQVCDLGGMSALTFALVTTSGAVVGLLLPRVARASRAHHARALTEAAVALAVWAFVAGYGVLRLREGRQRSHDGPWVLVVQTDEFDTGPLVRDTRERVQQLAMLTRRALRDGARPSLIVWPEAVLDAAISRTFVDFVGSPSSALPLSSRQRTGAAVTDLAALAREQSKARSRASWVQSLSREFAAPILVGGLAIERESGRWRRYNAAHLVSAAQSYPVASHFKTRPFPLYERVPLADAEARPLRWMHDQLARLRASDDRWPEPVDGSVTAGRLPLGDLSFAAPICFETEFSEVAWTPGIEGANFWVNIANDAWGERSDDTLRAFRFNVFRAVESRVTIARSANAGVAGFIGPTGEIYAVVGGPNSARMPMPGRPERAAVERLEVLRARFEALDRARQSESSPDRAALLEREQSSLSTLIHSLRAQALAQAASARRSGTSVARVRLDGRRTVYVRSRGAFDRVLLVMFVVGLVLAIRVACRSKP